MKSDPTIYGLNPIEFVNLTLLGLILILCVFIAYSIFKSTKINKDHE
jgi:hypothetical protein